MQGVGSLLPSAPPPGQGTQGPGGGSLPLPAPLGPQEGEAAGKSSLLEPQLPSADTNAPLAHDAGTKAPRVAKPKPPAPAGYRAPLYLEVEEWEGEEGQGSLPLPPLPSESLEMRAEPGEKKRQWRPHVPGVAKPKAPAPPVRC